MLQRLHHCEHLSSGRAVVLLSAIENCGIERYRLLNSVSLLTEDCSDGNVRSIRVQNTWQSWYWVSQSDYISECSLQLFESFLCFVGSDELFGLFLYHTGKRLYDGGKVLDEAPVITRTSVKQCGVRQFSILSTLFDCGLISFADTKCPRNSMGLLKKTHFDGLTLS